MNTINHISNNELQSADDSATDNLSAALKPDTDRMLLKYDVTYQKRFVLTGYSNVNRGQPNWYFRNKNVLTYSCSK